MEQLPKSSLQCHFFEPESFILKGETYGRENLTAHMENTRRDQPPLQPYRVTARDFSSQGYFASRSTERDCHLVVPPPAVPRLRALPQSSGVHPAA